MVARPPGPGLDTLAARAGWRVRGRYARGSCPCCESGTAAWGTITSAGLLRVGCWACDDWRAIRDALGLGGTSGAAPTRLAPPPSRNSSPRSLDMVGDAEVLDAAYRVFARHLAMPADQRRRILGRDRGLSTALRERVGPLLAGPPADPAVRSRFDRLLVEDLRRVAPDDVLARVPELWARPGSGHVVLGSFRGAQYLEPWCDEQTRVVALRAYMGKRAEPRYKTCAGRWGPLLHFAYGVPREDASSVPWVLTEGWMKAEVAAHALGVVAVAFAGVNQKRAWERALAVKGSIAPEAPLFIAFDAEAWTTRPDIAIHALELARLAWRTEGRTAGFAAWETDVVDGKPEPKGIDDALVAGVEVQLVDRLGFAGYLWPALDRWEAHAAA